MSRRRLEQPPELQCSDCSSHSGGMLSNLQIFQRVVRRTQYSCLQSAGVCFNRLQQVCVNPCLWCWAGCRGGEQRRGGGEQ